VPSVDAEDFLIDWLRARFSPTSVIDELPYNLTFVMPLVVVERYAGGRRLPGLESPSLDVDVFRETRTAAKALLAEILDAIQLELPGYRSGTTVASRVDSVSGPVVAPWDDNRDIRRATGSCRITLHNTAPLSA
jgi:hypothetical protein